jgi:hypothetical protein
MNLFHLSFAHYLSAPEEVSYALLSETLSSGLTSHAAFFFMYPHTQPSLFTLDHRLYIHSKEGLYVAL